MTDATTTTTAAAATHYRLSIEIVPHTGETGETITTVDLIATDATTGGRWVYVGPAPCSTQGEALELMARIYNWERSNDRTLDPTRRPEFWAAEAVPADGRPTVASGPEVACTPSVWPKTLANVVEVVEVVAPVEVAPVAPVVEAAPVAPVVKARKPRARRVDAGKARRSKGAAKAGAEMVGV